MVGFYCTSRGEFFLCLCFRWQRTCTRTTTAWVRLGPSSFWWSFSSQPWYTRLVVCLRVSRRWRRLAGAAGAPIAPAPRLRHLELAPGGEPAGQIAQIWLVLSLAVGVARSRSANCLQAVGGCGGWPVGAKVGFVKKTIFLANTVSTTNPHEPSRTTGRRDWSVPRC